MLDCKEILFEKIYYVVRGVVVGLDYDFFVFVGSEFGGFALVDVC